VDISAGSTVELKVRKDGNSLSLTLEKPIAEYLGVAFDDTVVVKFENGKWGKFIGVGKKGKH